MLGNFFMFLITGYLQIPLDPLEPSPTTLDLQTSTTTPSTHKPSILDPQPPRPTTTKEYFYLSHYMVDLLTKYLYFK